MASRKQIEANRRNARKSTGPKSLAGKTRAARNALKHGLRAKHILVPGEDAKAFDDLRVLLDREFQPSGPVEHQLVERMAACAWRLRRTYRIEAEILEFQKARRRLDVVQDAARASENKHHRMPISFTEADSEELEERLDEVREAEIEAGFLGVSLGGAFVRDSVYGAALSKLSRYETTLERALYRALHELQRLQAIRSDRSTNRPVQTDAHVKAGPRKRATLGTNARSRSNLKRS